MKLFTSEHIRTPRSSRLIRRYVPFKKLEEHFLERKALYFCNIGEFEDDKVEGTIPLEVSNSMGEPERNWYNNGRPFTFVSCWCLHKIESVLMWNAYSKGYPAVALVSRVGLLKDELEKSTDTFVVGCINYMDYDYQNYNKYPQGNVFPAFCKRKFFRDEVELRAIMMPGSSSAQSAGKRREKGILVPVDLNKLLVEVRVKPRANDVFIKKVKALLTKHGCNVPVRRSDIDDHRSHAS
jgi:hypothetical protein